jgi:hypothetical protein
MMKSIILSQQGQDWLLEHGLSLQEWDDLMIEQHLYFVWAAANPQQFQKIHFKIDFLHVVFELESDSWSIFIREIHAYGELCD